MAHTAQASDPERLDDEDQNQHCSLCLEELTRRTLKGQLDQITDDERRTIPQDKWETMQDRSKVLAQSDMISQALHVGDVAPEFRLLDCEGSCVGSEELIKEGPLILTFFRGGWCGHCTTTLNALRQFVPHYRARGASIVAVSPQVPEVNEQLAWDQGLNFPLLSDVGNTLAQEFGIAFEMDDVMAGIYEETTQMSASQGGNRDYILPLPATFILERQTDGRILVTYAFVNTDYTQRAEPMDILNALPELRSDVKTSLKYKLNLKYSLLQEHDIAESGGAKLQALKQMQTDLELSEIAETALKRGDIVPKENPLLNSLIDPSSTKLVKFSRLFRYGNASIHLPRHRSLSTKKTKGPIVLMFVAGRSDPFHHVFLEAMESHHHEFVSMGAANVVVVTPSKHVLELQTIAPSLLFLQDIHSWFADEIFGIAHDFLESESEFRVEKGDQVKVPLPATYVIDGDGATILHAHVSTDLTDRSEPSSILRALGMGSTHSTSSISTTSSLFFSSSLRSNTSSADQSTTTTLDAGDQHPIQPQSKSMKLLAPSRSRRRGPFSLKIHAWKPFRSSVRPITKS